MSKYHTILIKYLHRKETYLNPKIQNDILKCIVDKTLQTILNYLDSTIDIGRIDRFFFSFQFLDQDGEQFLCFKELPSTTANDYFIIIKKLTEE